MAKVITVKQAVDMINDNDVVMIGGFANSGIPQEIVAEIVERKLKDLTVITNDTANPELGIGRMISGCQIKKLICSHIGMNPLTVQQYLAKELEVELNPQGTLVERIRAGGAGLGGFLTPTGLGTIIEEGKPKVTVDGKEYLLEKALRARVALVYADRADTNGNLVFRGTARCYNPVVATAADLVIVEVSEIYAAGHIDPDEVMVPSVFVDYLVKRQRG